MNVKYQQVPVGKMKKIVVGLIILVALIFLLTLTVGSPRKKKIQPTYTTITPQSPTTQNTLNKTPGDRDTYISQPPRISQAVRQLPPSQHPDMHFNLKCRTCSLVGNSQMLLGSNAGSKIDSSECVFRINNAPTVSFEKDVGSKTTVRVFSTEAVRELFIKPRETFANRDELKFLVVWGSGTELCDNCTLYRVYQRLAQHFQEIKFLKMTQDFRASLR